MPECENGCTNCHQDPDAVEKKNWVCVHGCNLKKDFETKKKHAEEFYKNQEAMEAKARAAATSAYNKIFADTMRGKDI